MIQGALVGLRWGEVAGLRIGSLDLLGHTLTVTETVTRDEHGRPSLGPPKSEAGTRIMSLPQALADILAEHLASMGLTAADAASFVFPAPGGGHWSYANFRRRMWEPATKKAGLAGVDFHDLRRTASTQLALANVDMKTAGTRLGTQPPARHWPSWRTQPPGLTGPQPTRGAGSPPRCELAMQVAMQVAMATASRQKPQNAGQPGP
jgi:integrase